MAEMAFQVNVPSGFSNPSLEHLSETERAFARASGGEDRFKESKREYLRGEQERRQRGQDLGELVQLVLHEAGADYVLKAVNWNNNGTWTLEVQGRDGDINVVLDWFLVDDVVTARTRNELQRLRNMVLFGLGRGDLIRGVQQ